MKQITILFLVVTLSRCTQTSMNKMDCIVPQPTSIEKYTGQFIFPDSISIIYGPKFVEVQNLLIKEFSKLESVAVSENAGKRIMISNLDNKNDLGNEGYVLEIKPDTISILGNSYGGAFYGMQTLVQLMSLDSTMNIPCGKITDHPKYAWRGFMLDVARRFYPKEDILKLIDLLALYKINVLQLHLTDDQGWRIEIEGLPKLTQIGSINSPIDSLEGGFYTKLDMIEIIGYAKLRNVDIVPEIEFPGHSRAAIASYPELSCFGNKVDVWHLKDRKPNPLDGSPFTDPICIGKEGNYNFLEIILKEIAGIFPSKYIHLGGDECSKGAWEICELCQKKKLEEGLKDEDKLQGYFMTRVEKMVKWLGKTAIGWDEVYEIGVPKSFNIMSWREENWGVEAANNNYSVILAPSQYYYFNSKQEEYYERFYGVLTPLRTLSNYSPSYHKIKPESQKNIMGLQSCFWGGAEWDKTMYMVFPRLLAFSQQCWFGEKIGFKRLMARISGQYGVLDKNNVNYYVEHPFGLYDDVCYTENYKVDLSVPIGSAKIRYTLNGEEPTIESELFTEVFDVPIGTVIKAKTFLPNGRSSITVEGTSRKVDILPASFPKEVNPGLKVAIRTGKIPSTEDFEKTNEVYSGVIDKIKYPEDSIRHDFALRFSGYIKIPENGVYTFHSSSCDGSKLLIDGEIFLLNDSVHPKLTFAKRIALTEGYHKIQLYYFYSSIFEKFFMLEIDGPGLERQDVPPEMLFH